MLRYPTAVFPSGLSIFRSIPPSTPLRVLCQMLDIERSVVYSASVGAYDMGSVKSSSIVKTTDGRDAVSMALERRIGSGFQAAESVTDARRGLWFELWNGTVGNITDDDGFIQPSIFPFVSFPTDTILVQICGQKGLGVGLTDGPNYLLGLETIELRGSQGQPPIGVVTDPQQRLWYVPNAQADGVDTLHYKASDGVLLSQPAIVTVRIDGMNDAPMAYEQEMILPMGGSIVITLAGVDFDTPFVSANISQLPDRGFLRQFSGVSIQRVPTLVTDSQRRILFEVADPLSGGAPFATFAFLLFDAVSSSARVPVVINMWCDPGYFLDKSNRICRLCPGGSFTNVVNDFITCRLCPVGFISSRGGTVCSACLAGTYSPSPGQSKCLRCAPGTFTNASASGTCFACTEGFFNGRFGATSCRVCGSGSFARLKGQLGCEDCPENSRSMVLDSKDVSNCLCNRGAYQKQGLPGRPCTSCPFV